MEWNGAKNEHEFLTSKFEMLGAQNTFHSIAVQVTFHRKAGQLFRGGSTKFLSTIRQISLYHISSTFIDIHNVEPYFRKLDISRLPDWNFV